jgi:hypothetical protein
MEIIVLIFFFSLIECDLLLMIASLLLLVLLLVIKLGYLRLYAVGQVSHIGGGGARLSSRLQLYGFLRNKPRLDQGTTSTNLACQVIFLDVLLSCSRFL